MPAPLKPTDPDEPLTVLPAPPPPLAWWVRGALVLVAVLLVGVFVIAALLNPYDANGKARTSETHRTWPLNLPQCSFKQMTGKPCPSCGMTTSFALLIRGDVWNSLQANCVGTLLAATCLLVIPWGIASAIRGRPLFTQTVERPLVIGVVGLVVLMAIRWVVVLLLDWWSAG